MNDLIEDGPLTVCGKTTFELIISFCAIKSKNSKGYIHIFRGKLFNGLNLTLSGDSFNPKFKMMPKNWK